MARAIQLISIGYWDGPHTRDGWPRVEDFVDNQWSADEKDVVADYVGRGQVAASYMGYSKCRICGITNGSLDLTDGHFVWPEGLRHYVVDHAVRLPERFVRHVEEHTENLELAKRDELWWITAALPR